MRVLFLGPARNPKDLSPFIKQDIGLLRRSFDVVYVYNLDFKTLFREIKRCDVVFSWFATANSFLNVILARVYGKKSVVVTGGYDVEDRPDIGYGLGNESSFDRHFVRHLRDYVLRHADLLLAFSGYSARQALLFGARPDHLEVVYCGVDTDYFTPPRKGPSRVGYLTVGGLDEVSARRKGIVRFVLSGYSPKTVLGRASDYSSIDRLAWNGSAIIIKNPSRKEIRDAMCRAEYYVQLSEVEGFGISLAEAEACGCKPITSGAGSLPEIEGDRSHVVRNFSLAKRSSGLRNAIMGVFRD